MKPAICAGGIEIAAGGWHRWRGDARTSEAPRSALKLLGVQSARELAEVAAAVGLAQNFAAIARAGDRRHSGTGTCACTRDNWRWRPARRKQRRNQCRDCRADRKKTVFAWQRAKEIVKERKRDNMTGNAQWLMRPDRAVGIVGYGAYIPRYTAAWREIARIWTGGNGGSPVQREGGRRAG